MRPGVLFTFTVVLSLSILSLAVSSQAETTRADQTYYDLKIVFQEITKLTIAHEFHLTGSDASELRAAIDTNETYGNKNGKVDSDEVNQLMADLEGDDADIDPPVEIKVGLESYISGMSQSISILGATGQVVQANPDPIDFNTEIYIEMFVKTDVPKYEMNFHVTGDERPRTFYLTMPSGFPMNGTTFEPRGFQTYSSPYHINMTEDDAKDAGYLLLDNVRVEVVNTGYVDPTPPPGDDDIQDDDAQDDDDGEEETNYVFYAALIGIGILLIAVIVFIYKRSEKQEKEMEARDRKNKKEDDDG